MKIIYISDFNCPYSYIGLKRLKKAVNDLKLNVEWEMKSFELEPNLKGKKSLSEIEELKKIADNDGLNIDFEDVEITSSRNAHRLVKYAVTKDLKIAQDLVEKIFYNNFVKNENISSEEILTKIAVSCNLDENEVKRILKSDSYEIEVYLDFEEAISNGITATPCYILTLNEERLIMPGVFPNEDFKTSLKDLSSGNLSKKNFYMN